MTSTEIQLSTTARNPSVTGTNKNRTRHTAPLTFTSPAYTAEINADIETIARLARHLPRGHGVTRTTKPGPGPATTTTTRVPWELFAALRRGDPIALRPVSPRVDAAGLRALSRARDAARRLAARSTIELSAWPHENEAVLARSLAAGAIKGDLGPVVVAEGSFAPGSRVHALFWFRAFEVGSPVSFVASRGVYLNISSTDSIL